MEGWNNGKLDVLKVKNERLLTADCGLKTGGNNNQEIRIKNQDKR